MKFSVKYYKHFTKKTHLGSLRYNSNGSIVTVGNVATPKACLLQTGQSSNATHINTHGLLLTGGLTIIIATCVLREYGIRLHVCDTRYCRRAVCGTVI